MKSNPRQFLIASVLVFAMKAHAQIATNSIRAERFDFSEAKPAAMSYLVYQPAETPDTRGKRWPLLMFLHGAGERGANLQVVATHGPLSHVKRGTNFPFIIVAPQCPAGQRWDSGALARLLDHVESKYAVDTNRVYLTGLSMGGYGTWEMGLRYPERFAAIAPVCGGVSLIDTYVAWNDHGDKIKRLPIWAFHGAKDDVIPPDESARAITELREQGLPRLKLTVYPETGHDSWKQAYADPELYDWLLGQTR